MAAGASTVPITMLSGFLGAGTFRSARVAGHMRIFCLLQSYFVCLGALSLCTAAKTTVTPEAGRLAFLALCCPTDGQLVACAGKTTVLRNLLSQSKYKIGCVVNDVAAVNIDAKLIRNQAGSTDKTTTSDLAPTIELQNGCACVCPPQHSLIRHPAPIACKSTLHVNAAAWPVRVPRSWCEH